MFAETPSRILIECDPNNLSELNKILEGSHFSVIGEVTQEHKNLSINAGSEIVMKLKFQL